MLLLLATSAWAAGGVDVSTDPPGAAVAVDGTPTALVTPASLTGLTAGRHTIEVRRGCMVGRQQVEVLDGGVAQVSIPMIEQGGMLQLQLYPSDARVELNGAPFPVVANVPMAVDCGKHQLRVTAPGHAAAVLSVNVAAGRTTTLPVTLDPVALGSLDVDVAPPAATLWLDEQVVGVGPQQLEVSAGPHVLRATLDGYLDQERQVIAMADMTVPVAFSLEPAPAGPGTAISTATGTATLSEERARKRRPWIGLAVTGLGLGALGVGTAEYLAARPSYDEYLNRRDQIQAGSWPVVVSGDPAGWADDLYEAEVAPHRQRMLIFDVVGGVLVSSGLVLTFAL